MNQLDEDLHEKNEFVQAQVLLMVSNLTFCKQHDISILAFWRNTNLITKHVVDGPELLQRGP